MTDIFEKIYEKHKKSIYNYFYKSTLDVQISEELTQDTFLKAFRFFSGFKGQSSIKTWLFKIARNVLISYLNKIKNMKEEKLDNFDLPSQNDDYKNTDERIIIQNILYKFCEKERTLILLRDLNGFTYFEIAEILNITEGKVKIGLHRARKKFKQYYNIECERK